MLRLPLEMGICDYQEGHPADAWETMANAPWGVRLACRLLQERDRASASEWAPYLALIPHRVPGSPLLYTEVGRMDPTTAARHSSPCSVPLVPSVQTVYHTLHCTRR